MVSRINYGTAVKGAIYYNESKVTQGVAKLIDAQGYWKDAANLGLMEKLGGLEKLTSLNDKVKIKCVHISLNFDPSEHIPEEKLRRIAADYMEGIGFGQQPWLLYEHFDAAHPHIHIVTTCIKRDGNPINLNNIARLKSEPTRKALEQKYGLLVASGRTKRKLEEVLPINIQKVVYGKTETKRAISNVVGEVLRSYNITSLSELNAALRQFNVIADSGPQGSWTQKKSGLVYRILNEKGESIGKGIKASSIYNQPTLANLHKVFKKKAGQRKYLLNKTRFQVEKALSNTSCRSRKALEESLHKRGIRILFHENKEGRMYGVTFIDNVNRLVCKGSDLDERLTATNIMQRLLDKPPVRHEKQNLTGQDRQLPEHSVSNNYHSSATGPVQAEQSEHSVVQDAIYGLLQNENIPYQPNPYKKKKRKRKRALHL
jgi:hypothetical protein